MKNIALQFRIPFQRRTSKSGDHAPSRLQRPLLSAGIVTLVAISAVMSARADNYSDAVLADNPLVYYRFQSTGTLVIDSGAAGINGTVAGSASQGVNAGPQAPAYDGFQSDNKSASFSSSINNYISIDTLSLQSSLNGASGITIEMWINPTSFATGMLFSMPITAQGSSWASGLGIRISTNGAIRLDGRSTSSDSFQSYEYTGTGLTLGTWSHLVAVYDYTNGSVELFINGVSLGEQSLTWSSSTFNMSLGSGSAIQTRLSGVATTPTVTSPYNGAIDEFAIYDYALSASEIQAHYNAALVPEPHTWGLLLGGFLMLMTFRRLKGRTSGV